MSSNIRRRRKLRDFLECKDTYSKLRFDKIEIILNAFITAHRIWFEKLCEKYKKKKFDEILKKGESFRNETNYVEQ